MVTITSMGSIQPDLTPDPGKISNASLQDPMGDLAKPTVAMRPEAPPARVFRSGDDESVLLDESRSGSGGLVTTHGVAIIYPEDRFPSERIEADDALEALANVETRHRIDGYGLKINRVQYTSIKEDGSAREEDDSEKKEIFKLTSSADTIPSFLIYDKKQKAGLLSGPLAKESENPAPVSDRNQDSSQGIGEQKQRPSSEDPKATGQDASDQTGKQAEDTEQKTNTEGQGSTAATTTAAKPAGQGKPKAGSGS